MAIPSEIKSQIKQRVSDCFDLAEGIIGRRFTPASVAFNQRGKIAGSARLVTNEIRFNPVLLADNLALFEDEVVPHEVSHILVHQMFGKVRPHGIQWQSIMREVYGLSPHTRHNMDISKVQGKTFMYQCLCGQIPLSIRRHNKVIRQQQQYLCRKCCSALVAVEPKPVI